MSGCGGWRQLCQPIFWMTHVWRALLQKMPSNGIVAEIGVSQGVFAEQILKITNPEKLYLIDAWATDLPQFGKVAFDGVNEKFSDEIAASRIELLRG